MPKSTPVIPTAVTGVGLEPPTCAPGAGKPAEEPKEPSPPHQPPLRAVKVNTRATATATTTTTKLVVIGTAATAARRL